MDIAALIWDKSCFYPAMIDSPDAVKTLAGVTWSLHLEDLPAGIPAYLLHGRRILLLAQGDVVLADAGDPRDVLVAELAVEQHLDDLLPMPV